MVRFHPGELIEHESGVRVVVGMSSRMAGCHADVTTSSTDAAERRASSWLWT
jgi:hypothetical protein